MEATEHELWRSSVKVDNLHLHNDGTLWDRNGIGCGYSTVLLRLWIIGTWTFLMAMPLTRSVKDYVTTAIERNTARAVYCNE